jgi:hypothetical protein
LRQNRVYPVSQAKGTFISAGLSGVVERLQDGGVLKSPRADEERSHKDVQMEVEIYQRLGPHDRLVPMVGYSEENLVPEYMENGTAKDYLGEHHNVTNGPKTSMRTGSC